MSKSNDHVLLVPGESGWEIWTRQADAPFSLVSATATPRAADLSDLPAGDITLLFPVRAFTALPMRVTSDDESLFPDLAALHAERLGLRPDPMAGQLTDVFVVAREAENTALLSVFLRPPGEGEMPPKGPKSFDLSARAFPVGGDTIAIWREFNRWVFAVFHQGVLVYCQATAVDAAQPDESLAREIMLALIQLSMQGMELAPTRAVVWSGPTAAGEARGIPAAFGAILGVPVESAIRPVPSPPSPPSKLLPADVRAARREALRRRNITFAAAAVLTAYLGVIGWFGYGLWQDIATTKRLRAQAGAAAPDAAEYQAHRAKWDELAHAIDLNHSPVDILQRIANCIPPNSGLRLKTAEISATEIKLMGEAQQLQAVNTFSLRLSKNNDLANFTWQTPEPNQSTRGWEFVFTGEVPSAETQP